MSYIKIGNDKNAIIIAKHDDIKISWTFGKYENVLFTNKFMNNYSICWSYGKYEIIIWRHIHWPPIELIKWRK